MNLIDISTVNFYGDPIDIAVDDKGVAYAALTQITSHLGMPYEAVVDEFYHDPRVKIYELPENVFVVSLETLNALLYLLDSKASTKEHKEALVKYQLECSKVLRDYWLRSYAINLREVPYDINSAFKDERSTSRPALISACKAYSELSGMDPDDLFNSVLECSYGMLNMTPKHEYESLSGTEAKYLSWIESAYATTLTKFAKWKELYDNPVAEATEHVASLVEQTANSWMSISSTISSKLF